MQVAVAPEAAVPAAAEVKVEEVAAGTDAAAQPAAEVAVKAEEAAAPQDVVATGQPAEASEGAAQRSSKPASGVELGSFKLPADACLKQEIPLPRRMASCVIGIKGQSVTKLRRDSGSKIHVRPSVTREELDQVVEIEGSIESVSHSHPQFFGGVDLKEIPKERLATKQCHAASHDECQLAKAGCIWLLFSADEDCFIQQCT